MIKSPEFYPDLNGNAAFVAAQEQARKKKEAEHRRYLVRRERIATAAMQGLLARPANHELTVAKDAVEYADALIAALDAGDKGYK